MQLNIATTYYYDSSNIDNTPPIINDMKCEMYNVKRKMHFTDTQADGIANP